MNKQTRISVKPYHLLTLCLAAGLSNHPLQAAVLLDENFYDGDFNNAELPDSAAWHLIGSGSPSMNVDDRRLYVQTTTAAAIGLTTAFAGTPGYTLATGETIRVSFYLTANFRGTAAADAFRFGLFNSGGSQITASGAGANGADPAFFAWRGYSFWVPYGDTTANAAIREKNGNNNTVFAAGANSILTTVPYFPGAFSEGDKYVVLSITNNGTSATITASLGSTTTTWTDDTPSGSLTFDSFSIFAASSTLGSQGGFSLGAIRVETIPEPSIPALLTLVFPLGFFPRRRRA